MITRFCIATNLQVQVTHQVLPEGRSARLLDVQKHHHVVGVHVELEVIVEHLLVAEARIGQQVLLDRFAEVVMFEAGDQLLVGNHFPPRQGAHLEQCLRE